MIPMVYYRGAGCTLDTNTVRRLDVLLDVRTSYIARHPLFNGPGNTLYCSPYLDAPKIRRWHWHVLRQQIVGWPR